MFYIYIGGLRLFINWLLCGGNIYGGGGIFNEGGCIGILFTNILLWGIIGNTFCFSFFCYIAVLRYFVLASLDKGINTNSSKSFAISTSLRKFSSDLYLQNILRASLWFLKFTNPNWSFLEL